MGNNTMSRNEINNQNSTMDYIDMGNKPPRPLRLQDDIMRK